MGTIASTLGLLALLIYNFTQDPRFDGIGAMVTGLALGILSFFILIGAKDLLIGRSASLETIEKISQAVMSFDKVHAIVDLRTLILGSNKILINIEINVQDDLTTDELEVLIDKIEEKIKKSIKWKASIQIELETHNV
jgi:divalent metal cation (Fe/Co/Zn/Cd) transporter